MSYSTKLICMDRKIFVYSEIWYIMTDLNQTFPMKPSELKISISVKSYDGKTAEKYRKGLFLRCGKAPSFPTIKDIGSKF